MAVAIPAVFPAAVFPFSFPATNPPKPISLQFYAQSFETICAIRSNPSLALPRLRIDRLMAIAPKRAYRLSAVCGSVVGNSEWNTEEESTNSLSDAPIDIKLPRRRLLVQFTCNSCGERTERLVNRLAYERGLVFVQCAGCLQHHKLVDNLGLIVEYDFREASKNSSTDQV